MRNKWHDIDGVRDTVFNVNELSLARYNFEDS